MSFDEVMFNKELKAYDAYVDKVQRLLGFNLSYLEEHKTTEFTSYEDMRNDLKILHKGLKYLVASMGHDPESV